MTTTWTTHKALVAGTEGMVAAQHVTAARAGAAVLARGGNAIDAAVTTALVLSVVEPWLSGIGGGGFLLHRDGASGEVSALDFAMVSPGGIDPADYPLATRSEGNWFDWPSVAENRNRIGVHSICVPGAVAGFAEALAAKGTLSFAEALAPAIEAAEAGLEVDWFAELCLSIDADNLLTNEASTRLLLRDGKAPRLPESCAGIRLPMAEKAATLRRLAEAGARDFYEGEIARALVADMAALGGRMTMDDLAGYRARWVTPLSQDYRGARVLAMPGLTGGPALCDVLGRLSREAAFAGDPGEPPRAQHYAAYADAIRAAYADRLTTVGHAGRHGVDPGCTSHLSVVDRHGNVVSLTNTLLSRFGSKVTSPETGILLNNGMMWFDPRPGTPNAIAPGARPLANMCPLLCETREGGVVAIGAAGGRQIMPSLVQLLSFRLDFGMDLGRALSTPRIDASAPRIKVDRRAPADTAGRIARSHDVDVVDDVLYPVQFAIPSAVERRPNGTLHGMVHPNHPWSAAVPAEEASS
ncbi:gamma-glutamyltransferase family protein [Salinarimonas rosea]|uniref:gamma-glutamyltransferase family protein n=1 Tax=Salinarimonas rosea TaxID=552063 RepID=UPI0003FF5695|nr:gamma-glutamyltransferase [Salinarimonas rosea]